MVHQNWNCYFLKRVIILYIEEIAPNYFPSPYLYEECINFSLPCRCCKNMPRKFYINSITATFLAGFTPNFFPLPDGKRLTFSICILPMWLNLCFLPKDASFHQPLHSFTLSHQSLSLSSSKLFNFQLPFLQWIPLGFRNITTCCWDDSSGLAVLFSLAPSSAQVFAKHGIQVSHRCSS